MSDEELKEVLSVFQKLKQWRDENEEMERQARLRTDSEITPLSVRIH